MDEVLQSVDRGDLAFAAFLRTSNNGDFVVLANGDASNLEGVSKFGVDVSMSSSYTVLFSEFLRQRSAHDHSSLVGGSAEVGFARLASRRREAWN